jgi:hypothetical protein
MDKDHKKFMANQINLLHRSVDVASHSPQRICIVTDVSTPSLPLQSVMAFCLFFFFVIILYRDHIYYMYRTLREVVRGGGGGYKSRRQSNAKEPRSIESARGGREPEAYFTQTG